MNARGRLIRLEERRRPGRDLIFWTDQELQEVVERGRDQLVIKGYARDDLTLERMAGAEPMPDGRMLP